MTSAFIATVLLAVLVGLALGLLGGGGAILTVPILTYVAGLPPKQAIAASLVVVGVTSLVGAVRHARAGRVKWMVAAQFGLAGMAGAAIGGLVSRFVPNVVLMVAFALMMIAVSLAMIRGRRAREQAVRGSWVRIVAQGAAVGFVTSLVGAGGGFLIVPALVLLAGLPMASAVSTSLVVIAVQSAAGLAGRAGSVELPWGLVAAVTAAAVVGALLGARFVGVVPEAALRRGFGFLVLAMGVFVLALEVPDGWGLIVVGAAFVAGLGYVCARWVPACLAARAGCGRPPC